MEISFELLEYLHNGIESITEQDMYDAINQGHIILGIGSPYNGQARKYLTEFKKDPLEWLVSNNTCIGKHILSKINKTI